MSRRTRLCLPFSGLAIGLSAVFSLSATASDDLSMVVVPARVRMIQAAFDLSAIRSTVIVSCEDRKNQDPLLHVWSGSEWVRLDIGELAEGHFLRQTPRRAIVIGGDDVMPASVVQSVSWCPSVIRLPTMKPNEIVNGLLEPLRFSKSDVRWMARRLDLSVVDLNAEKKAHDPYSVPWSQILPAESRTVGTPREPQPAVIEHDKPQS